MVSIIIPTWNKKNLLQKNLPKVLKVTHKNSEVIVVENGSTDGSVEFLKELQKKHKRLKVIFNQDNLGFIKACNQAVKIAEGEFLVLLNNDVVPQSGFLKLALEHFKDISVFAVSFKETGSHWGSWVKIFWQNGFFNYLPGRKTKEWHISGWASGGSAVFRRSMWQTLGGFDPIFEPFYWEDLDLSYRAWKKGWKVIWEPEAKVVHRHSSTISKLDVDYVARVKERNQLIFIWKNIHDPVFLITHVLGIILRIFLGPNYLKIVFNALSRYRSFNCPKTKPGELKDREILGFFS